MNSPAFLRGEEHAPLRGASDAPWDIVFVDRDGTLNKLLPGYRTPADFELLNAAAPGIRRLNTAGVPVVLVTNQQGLGTGLLSWDDLQAVHRLLVEQLAQAGAHLDDIRVCPHVAGTCDCRKPLPGLFEQALRDNPWARRERCVMIGDADSDADAARAAGIAFRRVDERTPFSEAIHNILDTEGPNTAFLS